MSKFREFVAALLIGVLVAATAAGAEGDPAKGERVFKVCAACHAVGNGAQNRIGPHLNGLFGRAVASVADFKYSQAMAAAGAEGTVWSEERLAAFLANPRTFMKGTRMAFAGLRKEADRANLIAYLKSLGTEDGKESAEVPPTATNDPPLQVAVAVHRADAAPPREDGVFRLGRPATAEEIAAWDIDVRPDGLGLPDGRGTVVAGEEIFTEQCAACHGDFGEGRDRWPVLAGGFGTLTAARPEKTIGSYWPYLSTVFDYVRRAMPFGNARSLSDDEVYALTAYLLYLNDIVTDENFELSRENFTTIRLPNEANFIDDDRPAEPHYAAKQELCLRDCRGDVRIVERARILDVTPNHEGDSGHIE